MPEHPLRPLLEPASLAVVGATPREHTLGHATIRQALLGNFGGPVYPINPKYETILDTPCYASIAELPAPAELAVLAVGNERIEAQLRLALEHGVKAAVIFTNGYMANDREPRLVERLRGIAAEAGIPVCGANCLGFAQVEAGVRATWIHHEVMEPGPMAMITHSGTAFFSLSGLDPRMRYNLIVSPGQELVTTAADYLDYMAGLESTRVIGLLLEAVREPERFIAALEKANARDIPVVALKVGKTELSARLAYSHSGALAGNDAAYEAVFEHYGVERVDSMDELAATLVLLAAYPKLGPGKLASVHDSGGVRGMVIDLAQKLGVPFAEVGEETTSKLAGALAYGMPAVNPVDAWSGFEGFESTFGTCLEALATDPETAFTLLFTDVSHDRVSVTFQGLPGKVAERTGRPLGLALNWSRQHSHRALAEITRRGIPVLDGAENALLAVKHAFAYRDFKGRTPIVAPSPPAADVISRWRDRLASGEALDEAQSAALLADFGIPMAPIELIESADEAARAANRLGYPVVLKTAAPGVHHKSDVGGVKPGLGDEASLREAYADIASRLGPRAAISPMIRGDVELALGVVIDAQFGPLVMVGAGGLLVEALRDRRFLRPPIDEAAAGRALDALKLSPLLAGVRGRAPVDRPALCHTIARLGVLASALTRELAEVDVNPIIAGPEGCTGVDALVIPGGASASARSGGRGGA